MMNVLRNNKDGRSGLVYNDRHLERTLGTQLHAAVLAPRSGIPASQRLTWQLLGLGKWMSQRTCEAGRQRLLRSTGAASVKM